jgi:hypothetical protein
VALLGWANYEIATTLSFSPKGGKSVLDGETIELIAETTNLVTRLLRLQETATMRSQILPSSSRPEIGPPLWQPL